MTIETPTTIRCGHCDREQKTKPTKKDGLRLPPGWKRHGTPETVYCRDCWQRAYVLRAVTIPVGSVIEGGEWAEFYGALRDGWRGATDVSNWAVLELARNDTPRTAEQERLAPMKPIYLYPGARRVAPGLTPTSVVAVLHAIEGRYRKQRLATLWHRTASLPVYRYPVPLPITGQAWSCIEGDGGRPCITLRLGDRRWVLSLSTARHRRQLKAWRSILAGGAVSGELALLGKSATASDHRRDGEARNPGGGQRKTLRVMAKLVAWFPRREAREREGVLYVRTDGEHLLVYHVGTDGEPKYWDAAHVRRWEAQHRRHLRSMSEDLKREKRTPKPVRQQAGERQDIWVRKYRDRMDSLCHETTSMIAKFAERRGIATVVYDDNNRSYVERFPWHKLREQLQYKLDERGIALEVVAKSDTAGGDDVTAEGEQPPSEAE